MLSTARHRAGRLRFRRQFRDAEHQHSTIRAASLSRYGENLSPRPSPAVPLKGCVGCLVGKRLDSIHRPLLRSE